MSDPSAFSVLSVLLQRDDGGVVYLNGNEIFRSNMPTGLVNYLTPATISVAGTDKTSFHLSPPMDPAFLAQGDNVMAVEIHQRSGSSTSMDFNLALSATNRIVPPVVTISVNPARQVSLSWTAYPGKTYRVQYTTNLSATAWISLGSDVISSASPTSIADTMGSNQQRFYRVLLMD